jgi:hypothetical protein
LAGVNSTLFSVIDGVLIHRFHFPQADRLVVLNEVSERRGIREAGVSLPSYAGHSGAGQVAIDPWPPVAGASSRSPIVSTIRHDLSIPSESSATRTSAPNGLELPPQ